MARKGNQVQRYALFYTPPSGPFADFGAAWLGWDSATGQTVPGAAPHTERPRKYGFHATIKAPFAPADGVTDQDIIDRVAAWCATRTPVGIGPLALVHQYGYVALRSDAPAARALAGGAVSILDDLRAPLSEAELIWRRRARLSPRQDRNLCNWGYPYVFEDYEFHMTLSGRVNAAQAEKLRSVLSSKLEKILPHNVLLNAVTVMGEDADGMFHVLKRIPLER